MLSSQDYGATPETGVQNSEVLFPTPRVQAADN